MDKWVTVGGGGGVMEHILVSVQVTKVIVGWARLQVTVVYSLYAALHFNVVFYTTVGCRIIHKNSHTSCVNFEEENVMESV